MMLSTRTSITIRNSKTDVHPRAPCSSSAGPESGLISLLEQKFNCIQRGRPEDCYKTFPHSSSFRHYCIGISFLINRLLAVQDLLNKTSLDVILQGKLCACLGHAWLFSCLWLRPFCVLVTCKIPAIKFAKQRYYGSPVTLSWRLSWGVLETCCVARLASLVIRINT